MAARVSGAQITLSNFSIDLISGSSKKSNKNVNNNIHDDPSVDIQGKRLLHPVNAIINGGSLFGILGGSGSGKTTLLNVIADRYDKKSFHIGGEILLDTLSSRDVGYVTQQDYLLPCLTVRETILFTARLRVSPTDRRIENIGYEGIVRDVMMDLGLRECAHTRIGDDIQAFGTRGISGGEKRRVSIACQIITDPAILCADEPTSGLDSFTAITVMESLKRLCSPSFESYLAKSEFETESSRVPAAFARCPTTVICSIHQPRADVFTLFDSILLLSKGGHPVYCGPTSSIYEYFEKLSYICPSDSNPADYFVDISSIDPARPKNEVQEDVEKLQLLIDTFNQNNHPPLSTKLSSFNTNSPSTSSPSSISTAYNSSWSTQIYYLTYRFFLNNFRSKGNIFGSLLQSFCLGMVIMGIFWNLGDSLEDIESRNGLMYLVSSMENYILLIIFVERYCTELKIFDREIQDNMYSSFCYLVAHHLSSLPMIIIQSLIFALPIYFGCNLRPGLFHISIFLFDMIIMSLVTNGLAWVCVTIDRNFTLASLISNTNFTFITIAAGFLVATKDTPIYLRWIKNLSYINYSYRILMSNEFTNREFHCPYPLPSQCTQYNGNDILKTQAVHQNEEKSITWLYLLLLMSIYYGITFILLEFNRFPVTGTVGIQIEEELNEPSVRQERQSITAVTTIDDEMTIGEYSSATLNSTYEPFEGNGGVGVGAGGRGAATATAPTTDMNSTNNSQNELLLNYEYPPCEAVSISIKNVFLDVKISKSKSVTTTTHHSETINPITSPISSPSVVSSPSSNQQQQQKQQQRKIILDNISGEVIPGRLVALMGGSGSGKTTLLNLVAGRVAQNIFNHHQTSPTDPSLPRQDGNYSGNGQILFNNKPIPTTQIRHILGYVQQFDCHYPMLTVKETLVFHASIQLSTMEQQQQQQQRQERGERENQQSKMMQQVNRIIWLLGLKSCEHTRIGNEEFKGISGGEKRRLSIGIQLLINPSVCLLDEPTTGLDAFTAHHVMETLQNLSHDGHRTVIISIHQPRYDIFRLLDDIILLSRGKQIWSGSTHEMLLYLNQIGHPCPTHINPADYILDISSIDFRSYENETKSKELVSYLIQSYITYSSIKQMQQHNKNHDLESQELSLPTSYNDLPSSPSPLPLPSPSSSSGGSFFTVFSLLFYRSYLNMIRQPIIASNRISQGLFFALILAAFYSPIGDNQNSIQNRIGCLYELTALMYIGMLSCIAIFPAERNVFLREYLDGTYTLLPFFLSYYIIALPLLLITSLLISLLMTHAIGLQPTWEAFLQFNYVFFCFILSGESIGIIFCAIFLHVGFSVNIMSIFIGVTNQFAGFVSLSIPLWLNYIGYISPVKWGSIILTNVVFHGERFTCLEEEEIYSGKCPLSTGSEVLELYNMGYTKEKTREFYLFMVGILTGVLFLSSYVIFRIKLYHMSH